MRAAEKELSPLYKGYLQKMKLSGSFAILFLSLMKGWRLVVGKRDYKGEVFSIEKR
jgi:hypothetical protein